MLIRYKISINSVQYIPTMSMRDGVENEMHLYIAIASVSSFRLVIVCTTVLRNNGCIPMQTFFIREGLWHVQLHVL